MISRASSFFAPSRTQSSATSRVGSTGTKITVVASLVLTFSVAQRAQAQAASAADEAPAAAPLTLEHIMADPDWIGNGARGAYWSEDSNTIYFRRKRTGASTVDLWRLSRTGREPEQVPASELGMVDTADGALSPDRRHKVYSLHGDIFVRDLLTGAARQLTKTTATERRPRFLADGRRIVFERDDELRVRHLDSGLEEQPVELRTEDDPALEAPADDFLSRQQHRLLDIVRHEKKEEDARREHQRALRGSDPTRVAPAVFLGKGTEIVEQALAPSGDWMVLVTQEEERREARSDQMPSYVTADGYVSVGDVRDKVGEAPATSHTLVLVNLADGSHHTLDLAVLPMIEVDPLADLRAVARERERDEPDGDEPDRDEPDGDEAPSPRPVEIEIVRFSPDGHRAVVQAHSYDNKDRWLAVVERPRTGDSTLQPIHHLANPDGWINWSFNELGWLRDGRRLWFLSEETGWSQLFVHDLDTGTSQRLTNGDYLTSDVALDRAEAWFYFSANVEHPGHYDTYRVAVPQGASRRPPAADTAADRSASSVEPDVEPGVELSVERVTHLGGLTRSELSPDGRHLLITHSTTTQPPELYLQPAEPGGEARRVTQTVSPAFRSIDWTAPEIVAVPSSHMPRPIWSRLYQARDAGTTDADADAGDGRPAVVFIHGAGYLQNSHAGWSGYFREFMFHSLLTRAGYVILDMDYRGSRGYGRDWRTAIYRQMGHPEVEDLADGVAYLVREHGVDPRRVGVYGGSYGGFLTFMAMFRQPDLFAAGAALRPVTDWAHYNHPYTSNILNTPEIDPEAYSRSSPIEFADGLSRPLLICAGMEDDNVLFQDTVRLVQRLIELEKTDFETAFYPIEPHGFVQPYSWLDEYRRIFALFERHLRP